MHRNDIIDSRDLLAELRDLLDEPSYDYNDDPSEMDDDEPIYPAWHDLDDEDRQRVATLRRALSELPENTVDSPHGNSWGCTLVAEDAFTEYAEELAEDIGAIDRDAQWPLSHIDWEAAADALKDDYTTIELDGTTYYVC